MVEVSLEHIIGTIALIALVISAGLFYTIFTSSVQDDNRQKDLAQISENVALNIEEMINLAKFSKYTIDNMTKIIDLPIDIDGRSYKIQLMENSVKGYYVHTFLATQQTISADSTIPIPYNSGGIPIKLETTETVYTMIAGADNLTIACSGTIYGQNATVIWANLDWASHGDSPDLITVGIGWVEARQ
jgi:hypothetical protein